METKCRCELVTLFAYRQLKEKNYAFTISYMGENGAGEEIRTLDFNLGKVALYP